MPPSARRDEFLRRVLARTSGKPFDPTHPTRIEVHTADDCRYLVRFRDGDTLCVEVSIEASSRERSQAIYNRVQAVKIQIENELGYLLQWLPKTEKLRCTIRATYPRIPGPDLVDDASCDAAVDWAVQQIARLQCVIGDVVRDAR